MDKHLEELNMCLGLWGSQGYCTFGGRTNCSECGVLYLLWKLITNEVLHGEGMKRLELSDWQERIACYEQGRR